MINTVLFDLDGTLTDSAEGILNCVLYGLSSLGITETNKERLNAFIGPPLKETYMELYDLSEKDAEFAVFKYRERYSPTGIFENRLYDGITDVLEMLHQKNVKICLATAKPQIFADRILEHFNISKYFTIICGCEIGGERKSKTDVIKFVLEKLTKDDKAIMVGDRKFDVISAHQCGIECIGVNYGYALENELMETKAEYIADTVLSLNDILRKLT